MVPKMKSLKTKIEEKKALEEKLVKVGDEIQAIEGDKKEKIKKESL